MDFRTAAIPPTASIVENAIANFRKFRFDSFFLSDPESSVLFPAMVYTVLSFGFGRTTLPIIVPTTSSPMPTTTARVCEIPLAPLAEGDRKGRWWGLITDR